MKKQSRDEELVFKNPVSSSPCTFVPSLSRPDGLLCHERERTGRVKKEKDRQEEKEAVCVFSVDFV